MASQDRAEEHSYLQREAQARVEIDRQLVAAGWSVQSQDALNLGASPGVAIREFTLERAQWSDAGRQGAPRITAIHNPRAAS